MKVAFLAESPADVEALIVLAEAVLGRKVEPVGHAGLRYAGWPTVRNVLPAVVKQLHYRTDVEGLVLVVDSDNTEPHSNHHDAPHVAETECRLCQLRQIICTVRTTLSARPMRPPLKIALGLAVPAIEAWLLCGIDPHISEAAWINGRKEERIPYSTFELKQRLYGKSRLSLNVQIEVMKKAAMRIGADLPMLGNGFPAGFGALRDSLKSW